MLVLIAFLIALLPAVAILYPFLRNGQGDERLKDESSPMAEMGRRWSASLDGLKSVELEWSIGNLGEEDYLWLKEQYMTEAALVMRAMELEEEEEEEMRMTIDREVEEVRLRALAPDGGASTGHGG